MNTLPTYQELFGQLDFKKGEDARSVYSPAAYLADLLQLIDDVFQNPDLDARRSDIKKIILDNDNTFDLLPYLDIVNERLEQMVVENEDGAGSTDGQTVEQIRDRAYEILKEQKHPIDLPFELPHERLFQHLKYLNVEPNDLYEKFFPPSRNDGNYQDLLYQSFLYIIQGSHGYREGYDHQLTQAKHNLLAAQEADLPSQFGLAPNETLQDLKSAARFMLATGLTAEEMRELLYGRLSTTALNENGQSERGEAAKFAYNEDLAGGYYTLSADDKQIVFIEGSEAETDLHWETWLKNVYWILALYKALDYSISELELIFRGRILRDEDWLNNNHPRYREIPYYPLDQSFLYLAQVKYLQETYDLEIEEICSLGKINFLGIGDEEQPADLFNRTFNNQAGTLNGTLLSLSDFTPTGLKEKNLTTLTPATFDEPEVKLHLRKALGISEKKPGSNL